jgi:glycosyltransferase 2 family protein
MTLSRIWLLLQIVGTVILVVLLARDFDWSSFLEVIGGVTPWFYAWSLGLLLIGQVLYAVKWWVVLSGMGVHIPFSRVFGQYMISLFFGNFLPTSIGGDVARIYYLGQREGYLTIGASVFVDRCLGLLWISALATIFSWSLSISSPQFVLARDLLTACFALGVLGLAVLLTVPVRLLSLRALGMPWLPPGIGERIRGLTLQVRGAARQPLVLLQVLVVVAVYFGLLGVVYQSFFLRTLGERVELLPVLCGLLAIAVISNLPITISGIGLREQLHYVIFAAVGIPKEAAVAISLLIFSQLLLLSIIGGGLWLRARVTRLADAAPAEPDLGDASGAVR